jgi:diguanylate cyclase
MTHKMIETALLKIIPQDDPKQALRLRRFFMALAMYSLGVCLAYISYRANIMEWEAVYACLIGIPLINVILYIVFRTGLNLRMPDPSLTSIQMCLAILIVMCGMYYANEARGLLLLVYVLMFLFGIFRLNTRQFLLISAFALLTYGTDIALLHVFRPERINLKIEYLQWGVLAIVLLGFSFMGGHLSSLRRNLNVSRAELEKSVSVIKT